MIRERLWNGLLAALVVLSLALSSRLWFGLPGEAPGEAPGMTAQQPQVSFAPAEPLPGQALDLVAPRSIAVVDGEHALEVTPGSPVYDALWGRTSRLLGHVGNPLPPLLLPVDDLALHALFDKGPVVVVNLPVSLPLATWATEWQWHDVTDLPALQTQVDRLLLFLNAPGRIVFYGRDSATELFLASGDQTNLLTAVDDLRTAHADQFTSKLWVSPGGGVRVDLGVTVPAKAAQVRPALVQPGAVPSTDFATRFFPDMSVVREIINADHSVTYTDGYRLLRLQSSGVVDYVAAGAALTSKVPPFRKGLQIATDFVLTHGGFPEGVQLTGVRTLGGSLRLTFSKAGPTLVLGKPLLQVDVAGDRVVHYSSLPDWLSQGHAAPVELVTPERAVQAVFDQVPGARWEVIHAIALGTVYVPGQSQVRPAWVIWLDFRPDPLWVDAIDGQILQRG